jgi:C-terminal processing protease CtpA/Prc
MSVSTKYRLPNKFGLTLVLFAAFTAVTKPSSGQSVQRGEWEDVLKLVSADVQKNFYDPGMKGLDWSALTDETRQRIRASGNVGQMILAVSSLLDRLQDSHTYFIPPRLTAYSDFGFKAKAYGNDVRVYEIDKKGPADKAGLHVGDAILSINGVAVDRSNAQEVLRIVRAVVPSTTLDLTVSSSGAQARTVQIPAHIITTQPHQYIDSVWRVADLQRARDVRVNFSHKEYENDISYVAIPSFRASPDVTYSEIEKAKHARVLVLDLRGNLGGFVETVVEFLGFFTDHPTVLAKKVSRSQSQDLMVNPRNSGFGGSTIVLVDADSASGAELVARYLQLTGKATVLGDSTSGMVNEGQLIPEKIGAGFVMPFATMVTNAKLVMSNGEELERRGVIPDEQCVPTAQEIIQGADPCLKKALALAKKQLLQSEKH